MKTDHSNSYDIGVKSVVLTLFKFSRRNETKIKIQHICYKCLSDFRERHKLQIHLCCKHKH